MYKTEPLIRTKLRLPFTRSGLVSRPRLNRLILEGLNGPLTLVTAPAGFGKTTLLASFIVNCGFPIAWLSLDKDDNQEERFLTYLVAAIQEADPTVGNEAGQLLEARDKAASEAVLTSLINDLDMTGREMALVLDDYQFINSREVHGAVAFLLEHCPKTFHLVIVTRSDPPLPLTRLRGRGQTVELRGADLSFTELEAAQFLNEVMGLELDARSVEVLAERTEGWITGLQMAALSMRDRKDKSEFIDGFSGTNRYILDYLMEEVLNNQPPEIQRFLLYTSILDRLTAPLCEAVLTSDEEQKREGNERLTGSESPFAVQSASILEYLERANLFLMPLDDERQWYRYHHLFSDLLLIKLQKLLGAQGVGQLHIRASEWYAQNGSIMDAIHHASLAPDDARVERLIEQNYMELLNRGELSWTRSWTGKLSKELIYRRPWLCIYEANGHAWFGELDEAEFLLDMAVKRIQSENMSPDVHAMQGHIAYLKSRITAMRGDIQRAIELCLEARKYFPAGDRAMQLDTSITLGYEYFMAGDYTNASKFLNETVRAGMDAGSIINTVAANCVLARLYAYQGLLNKSADIYQSTAQFIPGTSGQHLGARALVEVGMADVLYERNDLDAALAHLQQGMALMPWWGKADDFVLAYLTLCRIQQARGNEREAIEAVEKAIQITKTRGAFSEARSAAETTQVRMWLVQGDWSSVERWAATQDKRLGSEDAFRFENELAHITRARVYIAQKKSKEAIGLLEQLEETAELSRRMGRAIIILLLEALTLREMGDSEHALLALTKCLTLAEPEGYVRIFLDEGRPIQVLLAQWLTQADAEPLRDYAVCLLSQFDGEQNVIKVTQEKVSQVSNLVGPEFRPAEPMLVETLSQRELEVLHLIGLGKTNQEIARRLIIAPGTVKAHTASIYRKLYVTNRTEAVARARQLGILP